MLRILVAEDDLELAEYLRRVLEAEIECTPARERAQLLARLGELLSSKLREPDAALEALHQRRGQRSWGSAGQSIRRPLLRPRSQTGRRENGQRD